MLWGYTLDSVDNSIGKRIKYYGEGCARFYTWEIYL